MIYLDISKTVTARHASGLTRVARRLREALEPAAHPVVWSEWNRWVRREDWFLTPELFSESELPGITRFLELRECRTAAVFHDAIPLQFPHTTWPRSVARHPGYLKLLARFDRILAVSAASAQLLQDFWRWQQVEVRAEVEVVSLGSDYDRSERVVTPRSGVRPMLLCVGILEPRKNQTFLLDVCEELWDDGLDFELHLVGRVNPHFGAPVQQRIREAMRRRSKLYFHKAASDEAMARLYRESRALVFPTQAEGCGLPLLEALWRGVPVAASDLPVLRETATPGGCLLLPVNDRAAWCDGLRRMLLDNTLWERLATEARVRPLPTWADCARQVRAHLSA